MFNNNSYYYIKLLCACLRCLPVFILLINILFLFIKVEETGNRSNNRNNSKYNDYCIDFSIREVTMDDYTCNSSIIKEEVLIDSDTETTNIITKFPMIPSEEDIAERLNSTCAEKSTLHLQKYRHKNVEKAHASDERSFEIGKKSPLQSPNQKRKKLKSTSESDAYRNLYFCNDCVYKNYVKRNLR